MNENLSNNNFSKENILIENNELNIKSNKKKINKKKENNSKFCLENIPRICSIRMLLVLMVLVLVGSGCFFSWIFQYELSKKGISNITNSVKYLVTSNVVQHVRSLIEQAKYAIKVENSKKNLFYLTF